MKAVIISGLPAVGKTTVGKIIAEKLRFAVVGGGDVLKELAAEHGVQTSGRDWWDTKEGIEFLEERKKSQRFDREVDARLLKKARAGRVVITSYTLPWLANRGIKVWLSGSVASRARRMAKRDKTSVVESKRIVKIRDKENFKIYKKLYGIEFGKDLSPFDFVVGTDGIDAETVAKEILEYMVHSSSGTR